MSMKAFSESLECITPFKKKKKEISKIGVFFKCFNAFTKLCLFSSNSKDGDRERDRNSLAITTYLISFNDKSPGLIISL